MTVGSKYTNTGSSIVAVKMTVKCKKCGKHFYRVKKNNQKEMKRCQCVD